MTAIGGDDLVIPTTLDLEAQREAMLCYLRNLWPGGILEPDEASDFFYYKDQASHDAWNDSATESADSHAMVYVLPRVNEVTVVHNGLDPADVKRVFEGAEPQSRSIPFAALPQRQ